MDAIGLSGFASSGKTTAAKYLEQAYGFERRHIAEPLRAMLAVLMRANGISDDMINRYLVGDLKDGVVIPELGKTSRELQISIGTEWGREHVNPNLWVDTWVRGAGDRPSMNDSVRFPNEEDGIRELGGITILIERPGTGPVSFKWGKIGRKLYDWFGLMWGVHDSERVDRLNPDIRIINNATEHDLFRAIDQAMWEQGVFKRKKDSSTALMESIGFPKAVVDSLKEDEKDRLMEFFQASRAKTAEADQRRREEIVKDRQDALTSMALTAMAR